MAMRPCELKRIPGAEQVNVTCIKDGAASISAERRTQSTIDETDLMRK